jgi:hypothetical protein
MTVRAAYVECTGELWLEIAQILQHESGWHPIYWSGAASMQSDVQRRFPTVEFNDNTHAVKGQFKQLAGSDHLPPLDENILAKLAYTESIALRMMDRMDPDGAFNYHQRVDLYYRHVQFSIELINRLQPQIAVFAAPPHLVYDYVLYQLCRIRTIPVVIFTETAVDGLVFSSASIEDIPKVLGEACKTISGNADGATLSASSQRYWERLEGSYDTAVPDYIVDLYKYQQSGRNESASELSLQEAVKFAKTIIGPKAFRTPSRFDARRKLSALFRRINIGSRAARSLRELQDTLSETGRGNSEALQAALHCTRYLYRAIETEFPLHLRADQPIENSYLKQHGIAPEQSQLSYLEYWLYRLLALRKKQALLSEYRLLMQRVDLSRPFIYVPLQYQPEVSTSPLGGVYVNQLLLVELLAKTVPAGWSIYVREHPFTFDKKGSGELTRDFDFHRRLSAIPNVWLIPLEVSAFDLIDAAKAVATVTGTSGWEAVMRGKPALVFGQAWYGKCEGVFSAADAEDCKAAVNKISAGYKVDRARVRMFLQALETAGFRGYTIPDLSSSANVTLSKNVANFVEDLKRYQPTLNSAGDLSSPRRSQVIP